jgi:hypothetical protein
MFLGGVFLMHMLVPSPAWQTDRFSDETSFKQRRASAGTLFMACPSGGKTTAPDCNKNNAFLTMSKAATIEDAIAGADPENGGLCTRFDTNKNQFVKTGSGQT